MRATRPESPLTPSEVGRLLAVSRETVERLAVYVDLLGRWQLTINLVGATTLADPWRRHVLDCGQLWSYWPAGARTLVDLGSGAGLPGLILAILGAPDVHLIESDRRKAAFLREAARATGTTATVHACRAEEAPELDADVLTARALAPLGMLLATGHRFMKPTTRCIFPKGRSAQAEIDDAQARWQMRVECHPSLSEAEASVLVLSEVRRA